MKSLAIKYRPKEFDDVCGQGAIVEILKNQLSTGTHKNAYLFTGSAGTGKTTCARIFANKLNKGSGAPIEIDAASNNGVDDVRGIIDNAKLKSVTGEYRVYIIDECHMLTTSAWNAMLKLLEEPPAKTVFILCTTDPQKIIPTILSRVQRYDFSRMSNETVIKRLQYIIDQENIEICKENGFAEPLGAKEDEKLLSADVETLDFLASLAEGGMRDAITLLDKCFSYERHLTVRAAVVAVGAEDFETLFGLTEHILSGDAQRAIAMVEEMYRAGADMKHFTKHYTNFLLELCKFRSIKNFRYIGIPETYRDYMDAFTTDDYDYILVMFRKFMKLMNEVKWESNPRFLVEAEIFLLCQEDNQ